MKKIITAITAAAVLAALIAGAAAAAGKFVPSDPVLPLSKIKPGMTGYARTVLSGTEITPFKVTILGIVPKKTSPKNLILIRVEDKYVRENGGIASGMSGSPVYVDGKLIGAIGYGWSFADNNLGLVTPIEEMSKAMDWPEKLPWFDIPEVAAEQPASADKKAAEASGDKAVSEDKKPLSGDAEELSADGVEVVSGEKLEKKMMPLTVDGISDRYAKRLEDKLGLRVVQLGSSAEGASPVNLKWEPKPGAAMGAALAWGDFVAGGIGTLTAVSKDGRFVAFAHPMFNRGSVSYAMMDASILKIIPSMESSFKLGYLGKITGLVTQDRPEAIGGTLGQLAAASSYTVNFRDVETNKSETKRFQTVADPYLGPEIGTTGLLGIIDSLWAQRGSGTALISYSVSGGNLSPAWTRRNIFYSDKDVVKSLQKEIEAMGKVMSLNPFREISPYGVQLDVEMTKTPRIVFIEKIEIADEKPFYKPGNKVKVDVTFRPWRKAPLVKSFELTVPEDAISFCEITVRGGGIDEPTQEPLLTGTRAITTFNELLSELKAKETNNQIIVEIDGPERDALKKKKAKTTTAKEKEKIAGSSAVKGGGAEAKKPEPGRGPQPPKKGDKESFTPGDLLEDRFVSEIKAERIKEGAMVIADTNYYIEGVLRKFIKIKSGLPMDMISDDELAEIIASKTAESADDEAEEETPPEDDEDDGEEDSFSILMPKGR
ncbi:hypothetical protein HF883_08715 [Cloacibacillus porcorum]|uniref:SpoIVB peptidase S55 domain-containing protein n=1 Tax=Cloacibacillus porcorum TaxID=1197717 RepID=UPI001459D45E|nr:SpoIVB peptidase S55 domain-containing protein [Cloacibacillus porcorum]MCC8185404.1 hypothetical protein [Cloacibacillus porcorum]MDY5389363.1 SpoIVB peptidase S55 domain-containing protein [Cloacibacillus porcorum]NMF18307.1 hypothetical protein [Cloacibacillus porcorum]